MAEAASTAISPPPEGSQPDQKFEPKVGKRVPRKKLP
jgi:hypothetical protein